MRTTTLFGPESVAAAHSLRETVAAKSQWPYPWIYPPPGARRVTAGADSSGTIVVPTVAAGVTQGLLYTVTQGYQFALEALVVQYLAAGAPGSVIPGQFTWSIDLNLPVGVTSFQGSPIQGFTTVDVQLGNLVIPWPLVCPEIFQGGDVIRSKFTNVTTPDGAPNYFKTILLGWEWPTG